MTLEEFRSSRREIDDVRKAGRHVVEDEDGRTPDAGYEYATGLYIVKVGMHWPDPCRAEGPCYLIDGNQEWIGELADLERILYEAYQDDLADEMVPVAGASAGLV
jgi:hypothetical protein